MSAFDICYPGALNRDAIAELIDGSPPLVADYVDLPAQLQPNGFDLTLRSVDNYGKDTIAGSIGVADADRKLPNKSPGQTAGFAYPRGLISLHSTKSSTSRGN